MCVGERPWMVWWGGGICKLLRIVYPLMIPQLCKKKMKTGFLCCSHLIYIMPANGSRVIVPGFMAGGNEEARTRRYGK